MKQSGESGSNVEPLPDHLKSELLKLAREALQCAGKRDPLPDMDLKSLPQALRASGVSFVTLTLDEKLRGCIGALEARMPLAEDVRQHTYAAALHDIRFPPVSEDEVNAITIEISVLSQPKDLEYKDATELVSLLRPEKDGVIISEGEKRATFLPQVWERIRSPSMFLSMLCEKAGLRADHWSLGKPIVQVYEVESFQEKKA